MKGLVLRRAWRDHEMGEEGKGIESRLGMLRRWSYWAIRRGRWQIAFRSSVYGVRELGINQGKTYTQVRISPWVMHLVRSHKRSENGCWGIIVSS